MDHGGISIEDTNKQRDNRSFQRPKITQKMRAQRTRWLGHVLEMPETINVKRMLQICETTKRRKDPQ